MKPRFILILSLMAAAIGWTKITVPIAQKDLLNAATKSLSLLQASGHKFIARSPRHCVSCHHNLLTALAEDQCRQKGIPFTDTFRAERSHATALALKSVCTMNTRP